MEFRRQDLSPPPLRPSQGVCPGSRLRGRGRSGWGLEREAAGAPAQTAGPAGTWGAPERMVGGPQCRLPPGPSCTPGARGALGSEGRGRAGEQRARRSQTYEVAVRPSSRWAPLEVGRHAGGNLHSSGQDPSDDPSAAFGLTGWRHRSSRGTPTSAPPKHELPGERGERDVSGRRSILSEMKHKIEPLSIASISVWLERGVQGRQWQNYTSRALYSLLSVEFIQEIMGAIEGFQEIGVCVI